MEELIKYIIEHIVTDPKTVSIETEEVEGETVYNIIVPENERGMIIGKEGKNIKSIRTIVGILAKKQNKRIYIKIKD